MASSVPIRDIASAAKANAIPEGGDRREAVMTNLNSAELLAAFARGFGEPLPEKLAGEELVTELERVVADAQAAYPTLDLDSRVFVTHVAGRLTPKDVLSSLRRLRSRDLYLACACLQGCRAAQEILEQMLSGSIRDSVLRMKIGADLADEVVQVLRMQLLVPGAQGQASLATYSGRGTLASWLRLSAVRLGGRLARQRARRRESPNELSAIAVLTQPEVDELRRRYQDEVGQALGEALQRLSTRERNLLRQRYLDGLGVFELGALYHVHNSTVCRWLAAICETVRTSLRQELRQRLKLGDSTVDSLLGAIDDDLEVSVRRVLG